ncbi:hypothetical protein ABZ322_43125 [Streptomyces sp. NPDC006129]|uniref:hypothetical protein n=1 Tax=Streptomyces sp. NPDC006129 TaxID=3155348 RepID=UPI0033BBEE8A
MIRKSWSASLEDSVYALGAAARECQRAYQAAVLAKGHVDLDRVRLLDGSVALRAPGFTSEHEPHLAALSRIGDVQLKTQFELKALYERTARAYAHGANWAIRQVQNGKSPACVVISVDGDGHYLIDEMMPALQLGPYTEAAAVEAARGKYEWCRAAAATAEGFGRQTYIADDEASEMHQALDIAAGLPDAAYAYGVLAEAALRFTITHSTRS